MFAVALSPKARALIEANRAAPRPTPADRERVAAALRERLGPRVLPLETQQTATSSEIWRRFTTPMRQAAGD